jgi:hypothetical protein
MSHFGTTDFLLEAARGNVSGMTTGNVVGQNIDVDTAASEDVWSAGGSWVAPTTARTHDVASTDANDDGSPAGTGARTLRIWGLTGWGTAEVTEDITMDGTSNVATANAYVIINKMMVLTKGASGPNVGVITATAQTDATVTAHISVGDGTTQSTVYGFPSTQTVYMGRLFGNILKGGGNAAADVALQFNPEPDVEITTFLTNHVFAVESDGDSNTTINFYVPKVLAGPGIIKIHATVSANNTDVSGGYDFILIDN